MDGREPGRPEGGRPPRGHAWYAEQARRALGLAAEPRLAAIPYPVVHAALGVAGCAAAVALRPGAVGLRATVIGVGTLCIATAAILAIYDRLVYPAVLRPPVEEVALPVAALGAFSLVLAGTIDVTPRLVAAAVTISIWGGLPHLGALRAAGREGWALRFLRDAVSIAVLVPVLLASTSGALPLVVRAAVVLVGAGLVTVDGLRSEAMPRLQSYTLAVATGALVSGVMLVADAAAAAPGVAAGVTLAVWYGVRGVAGSAVIPPRRLGTALEHLAVVLVALGGLYWLGR